MRRDGGAGCGVMGINVDGCAAPVVSTRVECDGVEMSNLEYSMSKRRNVRRRRGWRRQVEVAAAAGACDKEERWAG
jgi:hypothetical protein